MRNLVSDALNVTYTPKFREKEISQLLSDAALSLRLFSWWRAALKKGGVGGPITSQDAIFSMTYRPYQSPFQFHFIPK